MLPSAHASQRAQRDIRRGFTLVELVVSVAIIALLISITFYALRTARGAAGRTESLNAMRQMLVAYMSYTNENNQALMPGYINPADFGAGEPFEDLDGKVRLPDGTVLNPQDAASYVWRLAPYLDNAWKTFMVDYQSPSIDSTFDNEYASGMYGPGSGAPLGIALRPSYGINSIFVGGDSVHGDQAAHPAPWSDLSTTANRVAARRVSEVRSAARLIVFGATRAVDSGDHLAQAGGAHAGYPVLSAPYAGFDRDSQQGQLPQWDYDLSTGLTEIRVAGAAVPGTTGVPVDRRGTIRIPPLLQTPVVVRYEGEHRVPLGFFDGSTAAESLQTIGPNANNRMLHWSPFAVGGH